MQFFEKITTEQENKEIMCIPNEFLTCRRRKCVEKGVTTDRDEGAVGRGGGPWSFCLPSNPHLDLREEVGIQC